jgi:DNA-binding XRE family transcriptional regulator
VDPIRLGGDVRLLRRQRGWTQARLASEAHVSRWSIVQVEAGRGPALRLDDLIRVAAALGGYLSVRLLFHGETLDRLRDRRHAALVDSVVTMLRDAGWAVATEVSFNVYGERGSIDVLAFHPETGTLLVVEVKSVVPDVGGMLMALDRKVRHAREIAAERGWVARSVARLLVLPESTTTRRARPRPRRDVRECVPAAERGRQAVAARPSGAALRAVVPARCAYQRHATRPAVRTAAPGASVTHERRLNRTPASPDVRRCARMAAIGPSRVGVANI